MDQNNTFDINNNMNTKNENAFEMTDPDPAHNRFTQNYRPEYPHAQYNTQFNYINPNVDPQYRLPRSSPSLQNPTPNPMPNNMPANMPNIAQPPDLPTINARLAYVVSQIQQLQMSLASINNPNHPQHAQVYNFITSKIQQLKTNYVQLTLQQQQIQRNMQNIQSMPNNFVPNYQYNQYRQPYMRMNPPLAMPMQNMNRFQPRAMPFMVRPQFQERGRGRGPRMRRRKQFSSESEEEEELTTSDAESISQISQSELNDESEIRRSTRRQASRNYMQDIYDDSDLDEKPKRDEPQNPDLLPVIPEQNEGKIQFVEKILADRIRNVDDENVEEYFVKFKYYSYLHCEWCSAQELKKRDRNALSKIKRYRIKKRDSPFLFLDEDPFNPEYTEIDRILDVKKTKDPVTGNETNCYLVKWCGLAYDESTWEFEEQLDEDAISDFYKRNTLPPPELRVFKPKPHVNNWQKLTKSPVYKNGNILRDYQLEGINWLLYEYYFGTNCILADEMGLGKTIQSISFLVEVRKYGIRGPFLIIAPLSTIGNWYREFLGWSDFNVVVFHGAQQSRSLIHRYEFYFNEQNTELCKFEVLITTYEMILSENKFLSSVRWRIAIVDEAHRLKNRKCKLLDNLSNIYTEHRVLLTGTPLQNTLDELLSLLNFLDPARAEALENVISQGSRLETNQQVQQIQSFLKPVILRRLKEDVEKNIAPKEETIIEVEMTSIQKKVYRGILERNLSFLAKGSSSSNLPNLMNVMMELRKCCNHPFLINGVEDKIMAEFFTANSNLDRRSVYQKALIESSGKLVLVDKLLPKLRDSGHKMLIFSQMVRVLDLIEEYLVSHGFLFERIDGSVRGNLRQAAIDRFSKPDSDRSVFLLCTKAGGLGINLTAADTVIIFDSDWNPQNDIQAQARCHRIGQNKAVKVYRLICRKTYEREMFDRASLKLGLDKAVLQDINASIDGKGSLTGRSQLSKKEVEELLRRGAYAAVMDEDTDASAKFCSEDIEQILERRSTVIQIAGEAKGSTFAKASFNAEVSGEQVDIDDPDFWQKWAKSTKVGFPNQSDFIDEKPRVRKQIRNIEDDLGDYDYKRETSSSRTSWVKKECLKVEKQLLIFGWARWEDILKNGSFKSSMTTFDIEQISKTILVIVWSASKADSSFNDFVEKAMRLTFIKSRDSDDFNYNPHKRTRSKKYRDKKRSEKSKICLVQVGAEWKTVDIDTLVFDLNYKKHLIHCASKILIRLRLLFYIEFYILRDCKQDILSGVNVEDVSVPLVEASRTNLTFPDWWDSLCDKSLIMGTFKHGYEKYSEMKADPQLAFHKHISPPKVEAAAAVEPVKKRGRKKKIVAAQSDEEVPETQPDLEEKQDFPSNADLNTFTKRLVMAYWKNRTKGTKLKHEKSNKWTKKEEFDFYKALTVFGIEYTPDGIIVWDGFRKHGKFEKKDDISMSQYLDALVRKCLSVLNPQLQFPNDNLISEGFVNSEKAEKILKYMELFDIIRKSLNVLDVVRLRQIPPNPELPEWWTFEHDHNLLKASAIYGIDTLDKRIFLDKNLIFNMMIHKAHQNLVNLKENKPGITDVENYEDMSLDIIKILISWPKFKTIVNRLFGIATYLTTGIWYNTFELKIGNLIEKSRQLMTISHQQLIDNNSAVVVPLQESIIINSNNSISQIQEAVVVDNVVVDPSLHSSLS